MVEYLRGSDYGGGIGGILYTLRNGTPSYTHENRRGDVIAKTDGSGSLTYQATYEAYGKRTQEQGSTLDRQKANTKDEDPTGLLNEGFRYRDLDTGTFITRDPLGFVDGPNMYAYVVDNPWTKFDPEGLTLEDASRAGWGFVGGFYNTTVGPAVNGITGLNNAVTSFRQDGGIRGDKIAAGAGVAAEKAGQFVKNIPNLPGQLVDHATESLKSPEGATKFIGEFVGTLATAGAGGAINAENKAASTANSVAKSASETAAETKQLVTKSAAEELPQMKGMGAAEREATLKDAGFDQTKVGKNAAKNEEWEHADGSKVKVHPYGDQKTGPYASGNNAHMHKIDPGGNNLTDRGIKSADPNQTHIGLPNPKNLPQVRNRPHGAGS